MLARRVARVWGSRDRENDMVNVALMDPELPGIHIANSPRFPGPAGRVCSQPRGRTGSVGQGSLSQRVGIGIDSTSSFTFWKGLTISGDIIDKIKKLLAHAENSAESSVRLPLRLRHVSLWREFGPPFPQLLYCAWIARRNRSVSPMAERNHHAHFPVNRRTQSDIYDPAIQNVRREILRACWDEFPHVLVRLIRVNARGGVTPTRVAFADRRVGIAFAYADWDATAFLVYIDGAVTTFDGLEPVRRLADPAALGHDHDAFIRTAFEQARSTATANRERNRGSLSPAAWTAGWAHEIDRAYTDYICWLNTQEQNALSDHDSTVI